MYRVNRKKSEKKQLSFVGNCKIDRGLRVSCRPVFFLGGRPPPKQISCYPPPPQFFLLTLFFTPRLLSPPPKKRGNPAGNPGPSNRII